MIRQIISHYRILERLGEGGFGAVYRAEDMVLKRQVAIKFSTVPVTDHTLRARFLKEAQLASKLNHPNIATIHDFGETKDGHLFIVMELVEGETLHHVLGRGPLPPADCVRVITAIAEALAEAHSHGIIHRDIKPSNVVLTARGGVKLLDFGLAKQLRVDGRADDSTQPFSQTLTAKGMVMGTPAYMSPEQARGADVGETSDLFSLGAVLYECLTGHPPFAGANWHELRQQVLYGEPLPPVRINPQAPPELSRIALRALSKDPLARQQSAAELLAELQPAATPRNLGVSTPTEIITPAATPSRAHAELPSAPTTVVSPQPLVRNKFISSPLSKRKLLLAGAALLVTLLLSLGGWVWWSATHLAMPSSRSAQEAYEKGLVALRIGAYSQARQAFEEVTHQEPEFAGAHLRLAEALIELDLAEEAKREIFDARERFSPLVSLWSLDALYLRALDATAFRRLSEASTAYQQIARRLPAADQWIAENDLGRAYDRAEKRRAAVQSYLRAYQLNPRQPLSFLHLGVLYGRSLTGDTGTKEASAVFADAQKMFDEAERQYREAENFEGVVEALYQRGVIFYLRKQLGKARQQFKTALELTREKNPQNKYQEGRILLRLSATHSASEQSEAEALAQEAVDLAERYKLRNLSVQIRLDLGALDLDREDFDSAEKKIKEGLAAAIEYRLPRAEAHAHLLFGNFHIRREDADKAFEHLKPALSFYKENEYPVEQAQAYYLFGEGYLMQGEFDSARQAYQLQLHLALQLNSKSSQAQAYFGLGSACSGQEQYPDAIGHFQQSRKLYEDLTDGYWIFYNDFYLADMKWRLSEYEISGKVLAEAAAQADRPGSEFAHERAAIRLSEARLYLSQEKYPEAAAVARQAVDLAKASPGQTLIEAKSVFGLARTMAGASSEGLRHCEDAVNMAQLTGNKLALARARMAWADALLQVHQDAQAINQAEQAQEFFANAKQTESAWRAALLAARSSASRDNAQRYASQARTLLAKLNQEWGADYKRYLTRPDILKYQQQLDEVFTNNPQWKGN